MGDSIKDAEKRGYARGYIAGKKRADANEIARRDQLAAERRLRSQQRFKQQVFTAALQGLLVNGRWKTGDKDWKCVADYVRGAWNFADEAIKNGKGPFA